MASALYAGRVSKIDSPTTVWVQVTSIGFGRDLGPCEFMPGRYDVDDRVIVAELDAVNGVVFVMGRIVTSAAEAVDAYLFFETIEDRDNYIPERNGQQAWVEETARTYIWNGVAWKRFITEDDLAGYVSSSDLATAIATREPVIAAAPATASDKYWQGDKTWQLKTGLPLSTAAISALAGKQATLGSGSSVTIGTLSVPTDFTGPASVKIIPNGVGLNTYTSTGNFIQPATASATLINNYPIAYAGFLEVIAYNTSPVHIMQRYTAYFGGAYYARTMWQRINYNGTWSAWTIVEMPNPPHVERNYNTTSTLTTGVTATVPYDTQFATDVGITYSAGVFTLPLAGYYSINTAVHVQGSSTVGNKTLKIMKNGSTEIASEHAKNDGINESVRLSIKRLFAAGDTVQVTIAQTSGADMTLYGGATKATIIDITFEK